MEKINILAQIIGYVVLVSFALTFLFVIVTLGWDAIEWEWWKFKMKRK